MPDRVTGEPRPPRAPVIDVRDVDMRTQPWRRRKIPQPPPGEGPPLEWRYGEIRLQATAFGLFVVMTVAYFALREVFRGEGWGVSWMVDWVPWVILLSGAALFSLLMHVQKLSAGADWFMDGRGFVRTYRLRSVRIDSEFGGPGELCLSDGDTQIERSLVWLQANQQLWDLVYNGIRHSVAGGAEVNEAAVETLQLWDVVAMSDRYRDDGRAATESTGHTIFPNYHADVESRGSSSDDVPDQVKRDPDAPGGG